MHQAITTCTRCVLDTDDDSEIQFDSEGVCNYCRGYDRLMQTGAASPESRNKNLKEIVSKIKLAGKGKEYDCILGVSGGTDSSYLAYLSRKLELRPLIVHLDNGWDSELAQHNIENLLNKLGYTLHTHVINWEEFRDLQRSFLLAGVIDIELLTDHAIYAIIMQLLKKHGIKYTINGSNLATEAIMPQGWTWDKKDWGNIRAIHRKYGMVRLKTFPHVPFLKRLRNDLTLKYQSIHLLDCIEYNKKEAVDVLEREMGWRNYSGKHYESVFTKFYQAYILPEKFGVDKRKTHLSNLICSGQMTRELALLELEKPLYLPKDLEEEKEYVLKKLGFTDAEFRKLMGDKPRRHDDFFTDHSSFDKYFRLIGYFRPLTKWFRRK